MRRRLRKGSPIGDMQTATCRLALQNLTKRAYMLTLSRWMPSCTQMGRMAVMISSLSGPTNRFGTSPLLRRLFTSSSIPSLTICVSVMRNSVGLLLMDTLRRIALRSSRHADIEYPLLISTCDVSSSSMNAAKRASDWRPDPPMPSNNMCPEGFLRTRAIRHVCSTASKNMTRFICLRLMLLYSPSMRSQVETSCPMSFTSS